MTQTRGSAIYQGKYYQGSLSAETADILLRLAKVGEVESLRHCIYDLPTHTVLQIKYEAEQYLKQHGTLQGYSSRFKDNMPVGTLRPEQTIGVAYMYYAGSLLLGDDVGVGKTVQAAGLIRCWEKRFEAEGKPPFRAIFLAEKSSAAQIQDKIIKFTGDYVDLIESGTKVEVEKFFQRNPQGYSHHVVATHAILLNPEFLARVSKYPFDLIIFDESSALKNSTTDLYDAAKALFKFIPRRILLNATVFETNLRDIYNQLYLVDPLLLPPVTEFERLFVVKKMGRFRRLEKKGYKNESFFKESISLRYLARTRANLGAKFEDNTVKVVFLPLSAEQKMLMKKTSLYDLVSNYPTMVKPDILFNEETTPKLKAVLHLAEKVVGQQGEQLFIYCRYVEAQEALAARLRDEGYRVAILNGRKGGGSTRVRAEICADFNNKLYDILISNVIRGLDLTSCDNCILYTVDPNPGKLTQVEGRIIRTLDVIGKNIWMLVMMGKEKQRVEKVLKLRISEAQKLSNQGQSLITSSVVDGLNFELCDLFVEVGAT